jgi:NADH-quinone oxidoreductase subunit C
MLDLAPLQLPERFASLPARPSLDYPALSVAPESLLDLMRHLRDVAGYTFLTDVTAIDNDATTPRWTVVYHLYHLEKHDYLRVTSDCRSDGKPEMPSLCPLWPGANWHERETYDMFGIVFTGHPDLRRILMWDGYPYFPLRKEFPLAGIETEFPSEDLRERTEATILPAPMMGGPFTASPGQPMSAQEPRAKDQSWNEAQPKPE